MATIEVTGEDTEQIANALARALLSQVREMSGDRPGEILIKAVLNADGSYTWKWAWYPPADDTGQYAGSSATAEASP